MIKKLSTRFFVPCLSIFVLSFVTVNSVFATTTSTDGSGHTLVLDDGILTGTTTSSGYFFGQGMKVNVTGFTTQPTNPQITVTPNPVSGVTFTPLTLPLLWDSVNHNLYLGSSASGLPTYLMINTTNPQCGIECDPPNLSPISGTTIASSFTVSYSDGSVTIPPTPTVPLQSTDGSVVSNPNQPYKTTKASCSKTTWDNGICQDWKTTNGLSIPFTYNSVTATYTWPVASSKTAWLQSGFTLDWPAPAVGQKDVYVEIDYMTNHKPDTQALLDVINAFAAGGVTLHILLDEETPHVQKLSGPLSGSDTTGYTVYKNAYFGTSNERNTAFANSHYCSNSGNPTQCVKNLLTAKRQVFHYVLFGQTQDDGSATGSYSSGVSEAVSTGTTAYAANDVFVTLGKWQYHVGSRDAQEGTLMHELGHNLGLSHGGPWAQENANQNPEVNCKSNYLSVMSYTRQTSDLIGSRPLDYSWTGHIYTPSPNGYTKADISETTTGWTEQSISDGNPNPSQMAAFLSSGTIQFTPANNPDWDADGPQNMVGKALGNIVPTTFQAITSAGSSPAIIINCNPPSATTLYAYQDWNSLGYYIWGSSSAYDGSGGSIPSDVYHSGISKVRVGP